jgi:hypothetical protein
MAKKTGHQLAAGDYFEELMHCLCCSEPEQFSPTILGFIRSRGKGAEGVRELNVPNYYWVPSVPNFVNIDAAIVTSDGHMWCFQYTTHKTHTYKKRRLRPHLLNIVNQTLPPVQDTTVIFVIPNDITFTAPETGDECDVKVAYVDCTNLETVKQSLTTILASLS